MRAFMKLKRRRFLPNKQRQAVTKFRFSVGVATGITEPSTPLTAFDAIPLLL